MITADVNKAAYRHLPMINLSSVANCGRRFHPVVILLSLSIPTIAVPAGIMPLPQNDASDIPRKFVTKEGCHPHRHRFFLSTQLFLRRKANARSII